MRKNYKYSLVFLCFIFLVSFVGCSNNKKYIETNDNLICNNELYLLQPSNLIVKQIDKQCGVTDNKNKVFSIVGQNPDEFVCMVNNGVSTVYFKKNVSILTLNVFAVNKITINDYNTNKTLSEISDNSIIKKVTYDMNDNNVVKTPDNLSIIKIIDFTSEKYSGLIYSYILAQDKDQNCFVIDSVSQKAWKIGDELNGYMNS